MKTRYSRLLLTTLFTSLMLLSGFSQNSAYDKLQRGYITLGINGGLSFQTSDVQARYNGYGLGLTLSKNLYYHPASPISFDLRGRFLYARQYGLDGGRSMDIEDNIGLNGTLGLDYVNYPSSLGVPDGFVYHNYRTTLGELAAEGVLTWNTNRLGPGLFFSLYGGVGLDYFVPKIDQAGASGEEYYEAYANLDGSKAHIRSELRNTILDGDYETVPDNFPRSGESDFVFSLGAEAGIQLTTRFAVSLGHRITFSGNNLLDGHQWEDGKGDWYHYTSLGLHWTLNSPAKREKGKAPVISIIVPNQRPYTSSTSSGIVKARITNVQSAADIVCSVNGQRMPFDFYDGDFALSFPLVQGKNDVNIQASNPYGRDLENVVILYQAGTGVNPPTPSPTPKPQPGPPAPIPSPGPQPPPPSGAKPTVTISQPVNSSTTQKPTASVKATLKGVSKAADITLTANGQKVTGFDYTPATGVLTHSLPLKEGDNTITVKGTNTYGSAEATVRVSYSKPAPPPPPPPPPPPAPKPPKVNITEPTDKTVVSKPDVLVRATLTNISRRDQITFQVNQSTTGNFTFSDGQFQASAPLREGDNTITIRVKNDDGQAEDAIQVSYRIPPPPVPEEPEIKFTQPSKPGAAALKTSYQVKAVVLRVDKADQITFKLNGKGFTGFQFDPKTGVFSINTTLAEGRNDIEISASNASGTVSARTSVNYRKPDVISAGDKPLIDITSISQPASNPLNPNVATSQLQALITEIDRKEQIQFTVNGNAVTDFSFTPATGAFSATLILQRGTNVIVLKAGNRVGSAEERREIDF